VYRLIVMSLVVVTSAFSCLEQGSHASKKVLDFFAKISRTWKVLENEFGMMYSCCMLT